VASQYKCFGLFPAFFFVFFHARISVQSHITVIAASCDYLFVWAQTTCVNIFGACAVWEDACNTPSKLHFVIVPFNPLSFICAVIIMLSLQNIVKNQLVLATYRPDPRTV